MRNKLTSFFAAAAFVGAGLMLQACDPNTGKPQSAEPSNVFEEAGPAVVSDPAPKENAGAKVAIDGVFRTFPIYKDANSPDNHFVPSGWMGDYGDIRIDEKHLDNPRSGTTSIKVSFSGKASQGARWTGVYWQNPPNNWGTRPGGYDLTGAKKISFWVRGDKGGERIEEFKMGGITGEYADTDIAGIGPVVLTTEWQQFTIDLEGKDLTSISGGFCWATNLDANPDGATFYLDDILFE